MRLQIEHEVTLTRYRDTGPRCRLSLSVEGGGAKFMNVLVHFEVAKQIAPSCKEDDLSPLIDPLMLILLDRLSHMGEEGMSPLLRTVGEFPTYVFEVTEQDLPLAKDLAAKKSCKYQEPVKGELSCTVATAMQSLEPVALATTRHWCGRCPVPDDRLACSNFTHARIFHPPGAPIQLRDALCDRGEMQQDRTKCRPGGHACWEREVEFEQPEDEPQHALALHELFEFVDARWKSAFGEHLLTSRRAMAFGKLAINPCQTSADLEAKLSALAHVMKGFEVPDELLKEEHLSKEEYQAGSSLNRMESALGRKLASDPATVEGVRKAIAVLRNANGLRVAAQHETTDVALRYGRFGLRYPPPSAPETWARVQSKVAQALHDLADAIPD